MADREGNVLRPPGINVGTEYKPKEILASYVGFTQKGCHLLGGQGVIEAGTVIGRITATKKCVPYDTAATDGSEDPIGILRDGVDTGPAEAPTDKSGNIVIKGTLKNSTLIGLDAGAIAALNGRQVLTRDWFIF